MEPAARGRRGLVEPEGDGRRILRALDGRCPERTVDAANETDIRGRGVRGQRGLSATAGPVHCASATSLRICPLSRHGFAERGVALRLSTAQARAKLTPFLGARSGAGMREPGTGLDRSLGEALRFGIGATRSGSASMHADHRVRLMTVLSGRRVLPAANPGRPDIAVTRAHETMMRAVTVFVGRAV